MTPDELQALREKHVPYQINGLGYCEGCRDDDMGWEPDGPFYPCDVIKLLDFIQENWVESEKIYGQGHAEGFDKAWAIAKGTPFVDEVRKVIADELG